MAEIKYGGNKKGLRSSLESTTGSRGGPIGEELTVLTEEMSNETGMENRIGDH